MALSFPRTDLHDLTRLNTRFRLVARSETSRAASGITRVKELGPPLWTAEFQTVPMKGADATRLAAWLDSLDNGVGSFTAYDGRTPFPASDPTGAASLGSVQIASLSGGALSLKGLPAAFVLTPGDYLAFDWGSPARRAFHRVVEGATANGSGVSPVFEVRPHIRAGAAVDAAVTLVRPRAVWMLDPGSVETATVQVVATQFSFTATQVP